MDGKTPIERYKAPEKGEMLEAALRYAGLGLPVFPVHSPQIRNGQLGCSCPGHAGCKPGKHARFKEGFHQATTDPAQIRRWWSTYPNSNIGIATGAAADIADIDGPEGRKSFLELIRQGRGMHPVPVSRSGREDSGHHFWFAPADLGRRIGYEPHLDWLGKGGYVLAPPSRHISGATYEWDTTQPSLESFMSADGKLHLPKAPAPVLEAVRNHVEHTGRRVDEEGRRLAVMDASLVSPEEAHNPRMRGYIQGAFEKNLQRIGEALPQEWHGVVMSRAPQLFSWAIGGAELRNGQPMTTALVWQEITRVSLERNPNKPMHEIESDLKSALKYGETTPGLPRLPPPRAYKPSHDRAREGRRVPSSGSSPAVSHVPSEEPARVDVAQPLAYDVPSVDSEYFVEPPAVSEIDSGFEHEL